jgi:hypothetical protein
MSGISSGKKWDHTKLIQNFVSTAMGLLVAADVMTSGQLNATGADGRQIRLCFKPLASS